MQRRKVGNQMLIRHNVRTGSNQPAHFAHDTDRPDVKGAHVAGRTDRVITTPSRPCPQCGGYGALVPIVQLPRNEYPQGSTVPDNYRLHNAEPTGLPVGTVAEPIEPVTVEPVPSPYVPEPVTTPTASSPPASDAAGALMTVLEQAIGNAIGSVTAANAVQLNETVEALKASFDDTVKRLIVPVTIRIERPNREPITLNGNVHSAFQECLAWLLSGRNVYLVGPAGSGKTTLGQHLADALEVPFRTTGQVLAPYDVQGFVDAGGSFHETAWYDAFTRGRLHLADEMDGWSPEATLAMNAALANGYATFPNNPEPVIKHEKCFAMGAGNTWGNGADREYVGRNEMDAAARKRWIFIPVDYDKALETQIAGEQTDWLELVWRCRENARALSVREIYGTRELAFGVDALRDGMDPDLVATRILRGNMDDTQWAKVSA